MPQVIEFKFKLGNKVKDKVTGLKGIITGASAWITGCNAYGIAPGLDNNGKTLETEWVDEVRLEFVGPGLNIEKEEDPTGGPQPIPKREIAGY